MRRARFLEPLKRAAFPGQCIWVDTETHPEHISDVEERHLLTFGWAAFRRRLKDWKWSRPQWHRFETAVDFWDWAESKCRPHTATYWYAHQAAYDSTVLQTWTELPQRGWDMVGAVVDTPPFIVAWRRNGTTLRMLDTLNLWQVPLAVLGERVGLPKLERPEGWTGRESDDRYCTRDVEIIMEACLVWWRWLRDHNLGGAAATMAGQSLTTFRHRFLRHRILIDDHVSALHLARASYHGGRVEAFRVGELTGPLYLLDVRSEYPTVMQRESYPTVVQGMYGGLAPQQLTELLSRSAVVADVQVVTDEPVYPFCDSSPLLFPIGRFRTVLTSGELLHALERGRIEKVYQCAVYDRAPIFRSYVEELSALRAEALERGDRFEVWTLKRLQNALYGKFGQRGRRTDRVAVTDDLTARVWDEVDGETGVRYRMRQLAGIIERMWVEGESRYSHPAIAAHVTAYARLYLWGLIERAGRSEVTYCDTDSVLLTDRGYQKLRPLIHDDALGSLHLDQTVERAVIHTPKDYELDGKARTKGVRSGAEWIDANTVRQEKWLGIRSLLMRGDVSAPVVRTITKHLSRRYLKGVVLAGGAVRPFRLPDESGGWLP